MHQTIPEPTPPFSTYPNLCIFHHHRLSPPCHRLPLPAFPIFNSLLLLFLLFLLTLFYSPSFAAPLSVRNPSHANQRHPCRRDRQQLRPHLRPPPSASTTCPVTSTIPSPRLHLHLLLHLSLLGALASTPMVGCTPCIGQARLTMNPPPQCHPDHLE